MKQILYFITAALLVIGCQKKDTGAEIEPPAADKELDSPKIEVWQGDKPVEGLYKDGVITLEQSKNYHVKIIFTEDVMLQKGDFLKIKEKNPKEYYADFYGRNATPIEEKVVFKKQGYKDLILQIKQGEVVPDYFVSAKAVNIKTSNSLGKYSVAADPDNKTVWLRNTFSPIYVEYYGEKYININAEIVFPAPVFLDNVIKDESGEEVMTIKADESGRVFLLNISMAKFRKLADYTVKLPVYKKEGEARGAQLTEIMFKGDFSPYLVSYVSGYSFYDIFDLIELYPGAGVNVENMRFALQGDNATVFIDNLNTEYIASAEPVINRDVWKFKVKEDKLESVPKDSRIRAFDVYGGRLDEATGTIVKKEGAQKREIFLKMRN